MKENMTFAERTELAARLMAKIRANAEAIFPDNVDAAMRGTLDAMLTTLILNGNTEAIELAERRLV